MISDQIPPINIQQMTSDDYQPMKFFNTKEEAVDFIHKNGGLLLKDGEKEHFIVIRIPKEKK